jgi:hypothetical protein
VGLRRGGPVSRLKLRVTLTSWRVMPVPRSRVWLGLWAVGQLAWVGRGMEEEEEEEKVVEVLATTTNPLLKMPEDILPVSLQSLPPLATTPKMRPFVETMRPFREEVRLLSSRGASPTLASGLCPFASLPRPPPPPPPSERGQDRVAGWSSTAGITLACCCARISRPM